MSYIQDYKLRVSGKTIKNSIVDNTVRILNNNIANSPSYTIVTINSSSNCYGVQIVDDSTTRDQKLITTLDYELKNGDIIDWQDAKWINVLTDIMGDDIYYRGTLRRCVGQLHWQDSNLISHSHYFTFKSDSATNFGVQDGRIMSVGDERRILIVPLDEDSKSFRKDKRFIFDSRAWIITAIDTISVNGLLIMTVDESQIDTSKDNLELGIADYIIPPTPSPAPTPVGQYTVTITGANKKDSGIKKTESQTYTAEVFNNGIRDTSKTVVWQLYADDGISPSTFASIVSHTSNQCVVKAGDMAGKYFKLKAIVGNSSVNSVKRIHIKGLY